MRGISSLKTQREAAILKKETDEEERKSL